MMILILNWVFDLIQFELEWILTNFDILDQVGWNGVSDSLRFNQVCWVKMIIGLSSVNNLRIIVGDNWV